MWTVLIKIEIRQHRKQTAQELLMQCILLNFKMCEREREREKRQYFMASQTCSHRKIPTSTEESSQKQYPKFLPPCLSLSLISSFQQWPPTVNQFDCNKKERNDDNQPLSTPFSLRAGHLFQTLSLRNSSLLLSTPSSVK